LRSSCSLQAAEQLAAATGGQLNDAMVQAELKKQLEKKRQHDKQLAELEARIAALAQILGAVRCVTACSRATVLASRPLLTSARGGALLACGVHGSQGEHQGERGAQAIADRRGARGALPLPGICDERRRCGADGAT